MMRGASTLPLFCHDRAFATRARCVRWKLFKQNHSQIELRPRAQGLALATLSATGGFMGGNKNPSPKLSLYELTSRLSFARRQCKKDRRSHPRTFRFDPGPTSVLLDHPPHERQPGRPCRGFDDRADGAVERLFHDKRRRSPCRCRAPNNRFRKPRDARRFRSVALPFHQRI